MKNHYLIMYDIADPKRLQNVHKMVRGYGDPVQYSVFIGQLSERDLSVLREKLYDMINHKDDQIIIIKLGAVDSKAKATPESWTVLGKKHEIKNTLEMIY